MLRNIPYVTLPGLMYRSSSMGLCSYAVANCLYAHPGLHAMPSVRLNAGVVPEARVSITRDSIL